MISYLKKLMESKAIAMNYPCLFDDTSIRSLFGMLDVSDHGHINQEQYKRGINWVIPRGRVRMGHTARNSHFIGPCFGKESQKITVNFNRIM
jgi:hypothetical protein